MQEMEKFEFPLIEIQTNGIMLAQQPKKYNGYLKEWYEFGMTTVAISIVHYDPTPNKVIYLANRTDYIDLPKLVEKLHGFGFSVRLTCIAAKDYIDSSDKLCKLVNFAKQNKVEQLTITPVNKPEHPEHQEAWDWTNAHHLSETQLDNIKTYLQEKASPIMRLSHGAIVYDLNGQNICLNNCLTVQPDSEELRNIIFFPDGHCRSHWQYEGSILL
jgi:molybdenum cofactor biosynthesis enzyme MoaA